MKLRTYLARIKRQLLKKSYLKDPGLPGYWFDKVLKDKAAFLVQIGSNDGKTGDPLYPLLQKNRNWKALFVEPVPVSFEKLKTNYPDPDRYLFENVAINDGSSMTFYSVSPKALEVHPDLPYWYDQLGSFNRNHIISQLDGILEPFIIGQDLEGVRLSALLSRNKIADIDILHIDTEGYDWKILSQLDLRKYQPAFILFEQNHLSDNERKAAIEFLKPYYTLYNSGIDMLAINMGIDKNIINDFSRYFKELD